MINYNEIILVLFEGVYLIEKDEEMEVIEQVLKERYGKIYGYVIYLLHKLKIYDISSSEFDFYYATSIFTMGSLIVYKIYIEVYEIWLWMLDEFYEYLDIRTRNAVERQKETLKSSVPITIQQISVQKSENKPLTVPQNINNPNSNQSPETITNPNTDSNPNTNTDSNPNPNPITNSNPIAFPNIIPYPIVTSIQNPNNYQNQNCNPNQTHTPVNIIKRRKYSKYSR